MTTTGLTIVHTGDGKGKTTAALGLALRAWGDGLRVLIMQFIKSSQATGEARAIAALTKLQTQSATSEADTATTSSASQQPNKPGRIELITGGCGFTQRNLTAVQLAQHRAAARNTLAQAVTALKSGAWDMLVLDEINYAVKFGLLDIAEVLALLDLREQLAPRMHLVLTGREAAPELVARAELVTEMRLVKHPYQQGIKAQRGIEY